MIDLLFKPKNEMIMYGRACWTYGYIYDDDDDVCWCSMMINARLGLNEVIMLNMNSNNDIYA